MGTTPLQNWVKNSSVTAEQYMRYLQRVIASAEVLEFMFDYEDSNGSSLFYSVVLSPDFDDAGAVIGVLAISRNITALHKMLDRLHKSENEFRTLAENSPEMIIRYDLNLDQIYHNPAYADLNYTFPYLPRRKQASKLSDCLVSWQDYSSKLQQVIANGQSQHILLEWRALDGSMVSHDMHIVAEYAASGEVVSLLAMGHDVTQLKLSEQHLKESRAELRMLTIKREQAREQERKRIAREIHDELGQLLSVMRLGVSSLDLSFGEAIPYLHERVEKITTTIDHAILVARCLATRLRPAVLSAGIVYALEWMIEDYAENSHIDFKLSVSSGNFALEEERAVMVFRIVQESITNAVRHSAADRVEVALTCLEDSYEIEVRDNGIGFDTAKSVKRHSYGLVGMKERAMILGGVLEFSSECGLGTKIKLCIPMTKTTQEMNCGEH
jgi:PAS domain S-box-containing protein